MYKQRVVQTLKYLGYELLNIGDYTVSKLWYTVYGMWFCCKYLKLQCTQSLVKNLKSTWVMIFLNAVKVKVVQTESTLK